MELNRLRSAAPISSAQTTVLERVWPVSWFSRQPPRAVLRDRREHLVLPALLGCIHRLVGLVHQLAQRRAVQRADGYPTADRRRRTRPSADFQTHLRNQATHALGYHQRFGGTCPRQDDAELIPTPAANHITA